MSKKLDDTEEKHAKSESASIIREFVSEKANNVYSLSKTVYVNYTQRFVLMY